MPKIPEFTQETAFMDRNPPGVDINPGSYGHADEALQGVGKEMSDFGFNLLSKRKEAADRNNAANLEFQDMLDLQKYQEDLKIKMPDNYDGYTSSVQSWVKDRVEQSQNSAISDTAKQLYTQSAQQRFGHVILQAQADEYKNRAESYVTDLSNSTDEAARQILDNPNQKDTYDILHQRMSTLESNVGTTISSDQGDQLREQMHNKIAKAYFDGLYAKGIGDTKNGQTFLTQGLVSLHGKGKLEQGAGDYALSEGLTPDQKAQYLDRFERAVKTNQEMSKWEVGHQVQDYIAAAQNGLPGNPQTLTNIQKLVSSGSMKPEEAARTLDTVAAAQSMGSVVREMKGLPENQWDQVMGKFDSSMAQSKEKLSQLFPGVASIQGQDFNLADRQRFAKQIQSAANNIKTDRAKYPVESTLEAFPSLSTQMQAAGNDPGQVKSALQSLFSAQKTLGVPQKILTSDQEDQIVQGFKTATPQQQAQQISVLQNKYGDQFSKVVTELSGKQKIDPHLWVASYLPDQSSRTELLENLKSAKTEIEPAFKEQYGETGTKQVNNVVRLQMAPIYAALSGSDPAPGALGRPDAIANAVTLQAKKIMAQQGTKDPFDAVNQAMDSVVRKNFTPIQAANSNIMMPNLGNRKEIVQGFMEGNLSPQGLKEMNPILPDGVKPEEAYSEIQKYGRWVNPSGNTLRLQIAKPGKAPVYLRGQDGNFIQYDMTDISRGQIPDSMYQRAIDQPNKYGIQKLWERYTQ